MDAFKPMIRASVEARQAAPQIADDEIAKRGAGPDN